MARRKKDEPVIPKQKDLDRSREQSMTALKRKTRYFYDIQRLRLQHQTRLTPKAKGADIQLHEADLLSLQWRFEQLLSLEKGVLKDIEEHLKTIPFYVEVLSDKVRFRGIGPTMASVLLSEIQIHRQETPSQLWAFAGLAPVPARRCKKCQKTVSEAKGAAVGAPEGGNPINEQGESMYWKHDGKTPKGCVSIVPLAETFASGKAAKPTRGEKLGYNAFFRAKLCGVLGPVMLQVGSPWRKHYDDYKHRKQSAGWGTCDAHRHAAAIRYMIKMLLLEIWKEYREHEKLSVRPPYQEEYLGHKHGESGQDAQDAKDDQIEPPTAEQLAEIEYMRRETAFIEEHNSVWAGPPTADE
jgi:hypothetical protein